METSDTAQATAPEAPMTEQVQAAFAALRTNTEPPAPDEVVAAPTETTEAPKTTEVEAEVEAPKEKVRFKIGDEEVDEDTLLEWKKSGLRQADYTKKTQEVASKAQKLEQERAAERAETLKRWQALEDAVASATPKEPDWVALQAQVKAGHLPQEDYNAFAAEWLVQSRQRQQIAEERQKAEEAVKADRQKAAEAQAKQNYEMLMGLIPEWKDVETRQKDWSGITDYIKEIAPDLDESALLGAHPALFKALRDAQQYHTLQRNTNKPKVVKVDSATLKPGSISAVPKTSEVESSLRRVAQTHDDNDAVAGFRALRQAGLYK